jgi:hypothetical protein
METKEQYKLSVKQSCFFEKTNKTNKPLAKLVKRNKEETRINNN